MNRRKFIKAAAIAAIAPEAVASVPTEFTAADMDFIWGGMLRMEHAENARFIILDETDDAAEKWSKERFIAELNRITASMGPIRFDASKARERNTITKGD